MKQLATILVSLSALAVFAQNEPEQSGTPALLEVANGKKARVMLQRMENGELTFKMGSKAMTVPADKVGSLGFSMSKEEFDTFREQKIIGDETINEIFKKTDANKAEKLGMIFNATLENIADDYVRGDLAAVINALAPLMLERGQYMSIENNLQDVYVMLMESYRKQGDLSKMRECAGILKESSNPRLALKAVVSLALAELAEDDVAGAEALAAAVDSDVVKLYLQACIQRTQGRPKEAIQSAIRIIADHANDVEWVAPSELLCAQVYLDLAMTNSAATTARQVKNIYAGTGVAADAAKLYEQLQPAEKTE